MILGIPSYERSRDEAVGNRLIGLNAEVTATHFAHCITPDCLFDRVYSRYIFQYNEVKLDKTF